MINELINELINENLINKESTPNIRNKQRQKQRCDFLVNFSSPAFKNG